MPTAALSLFLVVICVLGHDETLRLLNDHLGRTRIVSNGAKVLVGLLMVSWTASFTYLEMRRYW